MVAYAVTLAFDPPSPHCVPSPARCLVRSTGRRSSRAGGNIGDQGAVLLPAHVLLPLLCFHILTNSFFRSSFVLTFIQIAGGVTLPMTNGVNSMRALLHSPKHQPACFHALVHSFAKTPGVVSAPRFLTMPGSLYILGLAHRSSGAHSTRRLRCVFNEREESVRTTR